MAVLEQPIGAVIEGVAGGTAVTVSGTVTAEGGLTDAELRASDVAVTLDSEEVEVTLNGETVPLSPGTYKGQQVISGNDASQNATLPSDTTTIWIMPRSGLCYVSVNAAAAAASSGVYVPQDGVRIIGPFSGITSLGVWAATGTSVHLLYEA